MKKWEAKRKIGGVNFYSEGFLYAERVIAEEQGKIKMKEIIKEKVKNWEWSLRKPILELLEGV